MKIRERYDELQAAAAGEGLQVSVVLHGRGMRGPVALQWMPSGADVPLDIAVRTMEIYLASPGRTAVDDLDAEITRIDGQAKILQRQLERLATKADDLERARDTLAEREWARCAKEARNELEP